MTARRIAIIAPETVPLAETGGRTASANILRGNLPAMAVESLRPTGRGPEVRAWS